MGASSVARYNKRLLVLFENLPGILIERGGLSLRKRNELYRLFLVDIFAQVVRIAENLKRSHKSANYCISCILSPLCVGRYGEASHV